MIDSKLFQEVKSKINELKIFDSHEHIPSEEDRKNMKLDFFHFFLCYMSTDLVSSGFNENDLMTIRNSEIDIETRWSLFSPYWDNIKNTMYSKTILLVLKDLFEIDEINLKSIKELSDKLEATKKINYYDDILQNKCKIEYILNHLESITDFNEKVVNKNYFLPVTCLDDIIKIASLEEIYALEKEYNMNLYRFPHFLELIDKIFESRKNKHYGLKFWLAYFRSLYFDEASFEDAEKDFIKIQKIENYSYNNLNYKDYILKAELKSFQNYICRYCIEKAVEYNIPVQIHTGMLERNRNDIMHSNPILLNNLFLKYKKARFDIFHIGYPFADELISMIKMFQNVYINMCWIPELSRTIYKNYLNLLIEIIPSNKIFGFGGDYLFVEGTYAAQKIAREVIAEVISEKITSGYFDFEEGIDFVNKILYINPKKVYLNK
jgi:predicted TIM-barrel fold metal-dependent hydrolase